MIDAVVFWNEPNNLSHWNRELDPEWEQFAAMVRLAGDRVGRDAPGLTRVLGGISPIDPYFVEHLFRLGVGDALDVVAVHGFPLDWNRWHLEDWPARVESVRAVAGGKPVWATEVGASSLVSEPLQAWALDRTCELLVPHAERVYWYSLMDLPEVWEANTRHRWSEGTAYFRHFRMGVHGWDGRPKAAAERLRAWTGAGIGVCEWVYWQEGERLDRMVERLHALGVRRLRTGIGWADWVRPGARDWFDRVMAELAPFEVALTLCFTPADRGVEPHHTSPPRHVEEFADFCQEVVQRYGRGALVPSGAGAARP
jgi:beta-xylosidase